MSIPYLPAELLDRIVDLLYDSEHALRNCCLASKSWIPRTRKHLFADVKLTSIERLNSWKEAFLDPSTSTAHYARTLFIGSHTVIADASAEGGGWLRGFSSVVHLEVNLPRPLPPGSVVTLAPFYGLSPTIKSLRITFTLLPAPQVLDLIYSFPLLEDLGLFSYYFNMWTDDDEGSSGPSTIVQRPISPKFTGSLELQVLEGIKHIARRLLSAPGGIHFRKLSVTWDHDEDILSTIALVDECSSTLESLDVCSQHLGEEGFAPIDLSKARKLKDLVLRSRIRKSCPKWVISALRTITSNHRKLQSVTIHAPYVDAGLYRNIDRADPANIRHAIGRGETTYMDWLELDRLLVQLWETHSIRLEVMYYEYPDGMGRRCVDSVLPEVTWRGIANLARWGSQTVI